MLELHQALAQLSKDGKSPHDEVFDAETKALVESFQRSRGLVLSGEVDEQTWERLSEARWHLGQRLLYLTRPALRGDDVAELQVLLAQLGFNPGRIDGIFGRLCADALGDFQRNCGLPEDETLTQATLHDLRRMRATHVAPLLVTDARASAGFEPLNAETVLLSGEGTIFEELSPRFARDEAVLVRGAEAEDATVAYAHDQGVTLVIAFRPNQSFEGIHVHYWAGDARHSRAGEVLASSLGASLAHLPSAPRVEVTGLGTALLRQTRMTTLVVEHGKLSEQELHQVVTAFEGHVTRVIHRIR